MSLEKRSVVPRSWRWPLTSPLAFPCFHWKQQLARASTMAVCLISLPTRRRREVPNMIFRQ